MKIINNNRNYTDIIYYINNIESASSQQIEIDTYFQRIKTKILQRGVWLNPALITKRNCSYILALIDYIYKRCLLPRDRIHYSFMENRGQDIGGFIATLK